MTASQTDDGRFEHRPLQFVSVVAPNLIYVGIEKREDFDRISAPCTDSGENKNGHVLSKSGGGENGQPYVIFQYWLKSLTYDAIRSDLDAENTKP